MNKTGFISTAYDKVKRLVIKVRRLGLNDIQTGFQILPWGYDSNPVQLPGDMLIPIFSQTGVKGKNVIVGYIMRNQLTEPGEVRIFQVFEDGIGTSIWLRNNFIELGADTNHVAMYDPIETAMAQYTADINAELIKIQAAISALGGAYAIDPITLDLSAARSTKAKTG